MLTSWVVFDGSRVPKLSSGQTVCQQLVWGCHSTEAETGTRKDLYLLSATFWSLWTTLAKNLLFGGFKSPADDKMRSYGVLNHAQICLWIAQEFDSLALPSCSLTEPASIQCCQHLCAQSLSACLQRPPAVACVAQACYAELLPDADFPSPVPSMFPQSPD